MKWELTGVPYTSAKRRGGVGRAIDVLRDQGLAKRLRSLGVSDAGDMVLAGPSGERGRSGLLNERALVKLVAATREQVQGAHQRGRAPLLIGGDCPVLLGALAAIRDGGDRPGLLMVDGHEDAWPPHRSETGEASDSEVAIALGAVEALPTPLAGLVPLVKQTGVALIGPRDIVEITVGGVDSLRNQVAYFADESDIVGGSRTPEEIMIAALEAIEVESFWLHLDLDVLSTRAFSAVDYPQPGGLDWNELDRLAASAVCDSRCRGASIVIYNPDLDPNGEAASELIDGACRLVQAC